MEELLVGTANIHSNAADRFTVRVEPIAGGKVSLTIWPGFHQAVIVVPGSPVTVGLQMPFTPNAQPLRLEITREVS